MSEPRVLISAEAIQEKIAELARQISQDYAGVDDLLMVGVLKGSFIFLADLARQLDHPSLRRLHGPVDLRRCHRTRPAPSG